MSIPCRMPFRLRPGALPADTHLNNRIFVSLHRTRVPLNNYGLESHSTIHSLFFVRLCSVSLPLNSRVRACFVVHRPAYYRASSFTIYDSAVFSGRALVECLLILLLLVAHSLSLGVSPQLPSYASHFVRSLPLSVLFFFLCAVVWTERMTSAASCFEYEIQPISHLGVLQLWDLDDPGVDIDGCMLRTR